MPVLYFSSTSGLRTTIRKANMNNNFKNNYNNKNTLSITLQRNGKCSNNSTLAKPKAVAGKLHIAIISIYIL